MITAVHHTQISIPIGAEEQARAFYCGVLGLKEVLKPENIRNRGGFWLQLSNLQVHVGVEDGFDRTKTKAHVAYAVDDVEQVKTVLKRNGIEPKDGIPIPCYVRFECRDPFGNRMEFIQRTSA
jgi:catechol 2,3-dioxygenase-like lactoylglutathione lyase family enzyme